MVWSWSFNTLLFSPESNFWTSLLRRTQENGFQSFQRLTKTACSSWTCWSWTQKMDPLPLLTIHSYKGKLSDPPWLHLSAFLWERGCVITFERQSLWTKGILLWKINQCWPTDLQRVEPIDNASHLVRRLSNSTNRYTNSVILMALFSVACSGW